MAFSDPKLKEKLQEARKLDPNRVKKLLFNKKLRKEHYLKLIRKQTNIDESSINDSFKQKFDKLMYQRMDLENT